MASEAARCPMPPALSPWTGTPSTRGSKRTKRCTGIRVTRITGSTACVRHVASRCRWSGLTLVDTAETLVVYETALDPRLYVHRRHVRMDVLERSTTTTYCPYKGTASYWTARIGDQTILDVAWSYEDPLPESTPLEGFLSFDDARVTLQHDLPSSG